MHLRIWRVAEASPRERERDMVDIVGGETLASLWTSSHANAAKRTSFVFQGRDGGRRNFHVPPVQREDQPDREHVLAGRRWPSASSSTQKTPCSPSNAALTPDDVCKVLFTSGTTSNPKGCPAHPREHGLLGLLRQLGNLDDRKRPHAHDHARLPFELPARGLDPGSHRQGHADCCRKVQRLAVLEPGSRVPRDARAVCRKDAAAPSCCTHGARRARPFLADMLYFLPLSHVGRRPSEERFGVAP